MIDISWPIFGTMTTYKNRNDVLVVHMLSDDMRESNLLCHTHSGTHVDAPAHLFKDGKTVDKIALDLLCGQAVVIDCSEVQDAITADYLKKYIELFDKTVRVLLKTKNSAQAINAPFDYNFVYLAACGARLLVEHGVRLVGIDYLGIERNQPGHPTHNTILAQGIIVEGLRLLHVQSGMYELFCLPLLITGADGAPARAFLNRLTG
jgi:arylformamidase